MTTFYSTQNNKKQLIILSSARLQRRATAEKIGIRKKNRYLYGFSNEYIFIFYILFILLLLSFLIEQY